MGELQQLVRAVPRLGQHLCQLVGGELVPDGRQVTEVRKLTIRVRPDPDERGRGAEFAGGRVGLYPVPQGDRADQLVFAGAFVAVTVAGQVLRHHGQGTAGQRLVKCPARAQAGR